MKPDLSVVIASVNGRNCILECLERLESLPERELLEIIVLDRRTDGTAETIADRFPRVLLQRGLTGKSIPELRWIGMRRAQADWIAILEDHSMVTSAWAAEVLKFANSPYGVVAGPVENGSRKRLTDWACFLAEYSACMPPLADSEVEQLPGNNTVYRRDILPLLEAQWGSVWESFLQEELKRLDVRMFLNGALLVYHKKSFTLAEMLAQRYLYSRSFAGMRARAMTASRRAAYASGSLVLPAIVLLRITKRVFEKKRNLREFVLSSPLIALYAVSWGLGEMAGYALGSGDSLARVN